MIYQTMETCHRLQNVQATLMLVCDTCIVFPQIHIHPTLMLMCDICILFPQIHIQATLRCSPPSPVTLLTSQTSPYLWALSKCLRPAHLKEHTIGSLHPYELCS